MALKNKRHNLSHAEVQVLVKNYLLMTLGCFFLAVGDALFLTPCNIVSGGVSSIGIIVNFYVQKQWPNAFDVNSLVVAVLEIGLLILGFFVLGKKFAARTLFASIVYPLFYAALFDCHVGQLIGLGALYDASNTAYLLISAIFGGAFVGLGVALGYSGSGSTGGFDILSEIIAKYTDVKQDVSGFVIDAAIIIIGMICMQQMINGLIGILAAFCCALSVQFVYIYMNAYVIVDVISDHYEEIQKFIHKDMDHATTVIDTVGGYTGEKRKLIRVVIYHNETGILRSYIASVDPKAFISFTEAKTINGEGFEPLMIHSHKQRSIKESKLLEACEIKDKRIEEEKKEQEEALKKDK